MKEEDKGIYKYMNKTLIQKRISYTCEGCFFYENFTENYPCCIKVGGRFLYPCSKNIIYIENDKSK